MGHLFDALTCLYSGTDSGQTHIHIGNLLIFAYFPQQSRLEGVRRLGKQVGWSCASDYYRAESKS